MFDEVDHFVPLVCLYRFINAGARRNPAASTFQGCFHNVPSRALLRVDAADPAFVPGSKVFYASRIVTQGVLPQIGRVRLPKPCWSIDHLEQQVHGPGRIEPVRRNRALCAAREPVGCVHSCSVNMTDLCVLIQSVCRNDTIVDAYAPLNVTA